MNEENITIHFDLDPKNLSTSDWSHFDAMTEEERHLAALSDPDSLPASEEQLMRARRVPTVYNLRRKLNLTQAQFAHRFQLSLGAVRDWEQGRTQPDHAARTLLRVIEFNPDAVEKALQPV
ncbi:MAG: helix-turn-helix domain-containing protein [Chloroflexi bacterium]|nr:helix-turn-helix domain-containing protein [Chloroflexota bacterium]